MEKINKSQNQNEKLNGEKNEKNTSPTFNFDFNFEDKKKIWH